ncbi:hypothetical protein HNP87_001495 [Methanococcus maripaludis]|nr:hypothetical protein [Methanococcus maripaludis]
MSILLLPANFASDGGLEIEMPEEITAGDLFTIEVNVKNNVEVCGFECELKIPLEEQDNFEIVNVTGNNEIGEKAGQFYEIKTTKSGVLNRFTVFDEPVAEDFHAFTVQLKALNSGDNTITFVSECADMDGNAIPVDTVEKELTVLVNPELELKNNDSLSNLIKSILNFFFGG